MNHFLLSKIIILACLLCVSIGQNHQAEANARANAGSLAAIKNIPRYGGDSSLDPEDFKFSGSNFSEFPPYLKGIVSTLLIPLILVGLSVLLCPFWTLCRCCQCCCCKKKRPKNPVTKCQIYAPYFLVLSSVIAIVAMAAIAYSANLDFSGALLYNEGEGADGNLFGVGEELLSDAVNKSHGIIVNVIDIGDEAIAVIDGVQSLLNDTAPKITGGTYGLISMLYSISELWSNYNVTTQYNNETYSFTCVFCTTFGESIGNITEEIEGQVGPVFSDLNDTINSINSDLIGQEEDITSSLSTAVTMLNDTYFLLLDSEEFYLDFRPMVEGFNKKRELGYNIIFAIPLLPIIFILFGGILKKPICFSLSYICLWCSCTLMWLLLIFHLPIAVLLNDTCGFLDVLDQNVSAVIRNNSNAELFQACLDDASGFEVAIIMKMEQLTDISGSIQFPTLGNLSQEFQFSSLVSFEDDAFHTNFTTFYANGDMALTTINNMTANPLNLLAGCCQFNRDNISTLNSSAFYPYNSSAQIALESLKDVLMAEAVAIPAFNDTIYKIRANISSVTNQVGVVEGDVENVEEKVNNASHLVNPLIDAVNRMNISLKCGFIGDAYFNTKLVMCNSVLGSLSRIVVSMFVIAILSLFSCLWTTKLVRKVEYWQEQKKEAADRKLQEAFQPNKPAVVIMQPLMANQPGQIAAQGMYNYSSQI